jgi:hypothetical protein
LPSESINGSSSAFKSPVDGACFTTLGILSAWRN